MIKTKKSVLFVVVISLMLITAIIFSGCSSMLNISAFLEKADKSKNFTMSFEWNMSTGASKDIYAYNKNYTYMSNQSNEFIIDKTKKENVIMYRKVYNLWGRSSEIPFIEYKESVMISDQFTANTSEKSYGYVYAGQIMDLARKEFKASFTRSDDDRDKYVLNSDKSKEIFIKYTGISYSANCKAYCYKINNKVIFELEYGTVKLKVELYKLKGTKITVTNEMLEAQQYNKDYFLKSLS